MKCFALLFIVLVSTSLFSQDCIIDEWIEKEYFFDSQILALREIISDTNHEYKDSVVLPLRITNKYLGIISSVYSQGTELTDTLFNYYSIHTFPDIPYSQIAMLVDTSYIWVKTYIQDSLISGNFKFDSITSLYNFKLKYVTYLTSSIYIRIESSETLNLQPLVAAFESIDGIESAEPLNSWYGDGDDIEVTFSNDTSFIYFSIGWGDCPAGCINRYYWEYSVFNCISKFERSYGDPITIIDNSSVQDILVFPNPLRNKVFISNSTGKRLTILIYTLKGELILKQHTMSGSIDLSMFNSGIYLLTILTNKESKTIKIFKR